MDSKKIESEIKNIKARNARVELDKKMGDFLDAEDLHLCSYLYCGCGLLFYD